MRPVLKPALRRLWRDPATLQIGQDPERAVVLAGLDLPTARLVESLDGTRDLAGVLARARAVGVGEDRARRLLDLLSGGGVLDDAAADHRPLAALSGADRDRLAPDLASLSLVSERPDGGVAALGRRRSACVLVAGAGRVGGAVAVLLAAAGVGHVVVDDPEPLRAGDAGLAGLCRDGVGASRQHAVTVAMRSLAPATRADLPADRRGPDVAVLAAANAEPQHELADRLLRQGVPHLVATVRETTGVVGPFVLPGRSSCTRCLDLHRADRDPAWPRIVAQLVGGARGRVAPCDVTLATLVAAQATLQVLALLDGTGRPGSIDGTFETRLPEGTARRRSWAPHPGCGCRWRS